MGQAREGRVKIVSLALRYMRFIHKFGLCGNLKTPPNGDSSNSDPSICSQAGV